MPTQQQGYKMIWDYCKWLHRYENWGDPDRMNSLLVLALDFVRDISKQPIVVNCGYALGGHAEKSFHYTGDAVDFHMIGCDLPTAATKVLEAIKKLNIKYYGLGAYPHWNQQGFHFDLGYRAGNEKLYWVQNEQGKYDYYHDAGSWIKAISL